MIVCCVFVSCVMYGFVIMCFVRYVLFVVCLCFSFCFGVCMVWVCYLFVAVSVV